MKSDDRRQRETDKDTAAKAIGAIKQLIVKRQV